MNGLIVFLIPPKELISGGIMSIFSLAAESRTLKKIHQSDVYISVYPGTISYKKNTLFENSEIIYEFDKLLATHKEIDNLSIHIPEYAVREVLTELTKRIDTFPPKVHINILNQNIEHMPEARDIAGLYTLTNNVTQTVAHKRYASQEVANKYSLPTHLLGVYINESQYERGNFSKKEKLILYSPDENINKSRIIKKMRDDLPEYQLLEINNFTYKQYKDFINRAAYTITFGEGFDGYFIEPTFSGSIPIAVYNDVFFPSKDYLDYPNVFASYENFSNNASTLIKGLSENSYNKLNLQLTDKLKDIYSRHVYVENIRLFYGGKYSFMPSDISLVSLLKEVVKLANSHSSQLRDSLQGQQKIITELEKIIKEQADELITIKQSKAWIYTTKIRNIIHLGK